MKLDVLPSQMNLIMQILEANLPSDVKVYAFGSRVRGDAKLYSDLDLGVDLNGEKLDFPTISKLSSEFENSTIPYKIDVVDLNSISENFMEKIKNDLVLL